MCFIECGDYVVVDTPGSPTGEYCQDVPPRKPGEKHSGPPILPPHLLQVILNKDTPAHVSVDISAYYINLSSLIVGLGFSKTKYQLSWYMYLSEKITVLIFFF